MKAKIGKFEIDGTAIEIAELIQKFEQPQAERKLQNHHAFRGRQAEMIVGLLEKQPKLLEPGVSTQTIAKHYHAMYGLKPNANFFPINLSVAKNIMRKRQKNFVTEGKFKVGRRKSRKAYHDWTTTDIGLIRELLGEGKNLRTIGKRIGVSASAISRQIGKHKIRKQLINSHIRKRWTPQEVNELLELKDKGLTTQEISTKLNRKPKAITNKLVNVRKTQKHKNNGDMTRYES